MDEFADPYFDSIEEQDLRQVTRAGTVVEVETTFTPSPPPRPQIFLNMETSTWQTAAEMNGGQLSHCRAKYCPDILGSLFATCRILMLPAVRSSSPESVAVATCTLQRLAIEVSLLGGATCQELLPPVTHVVVVSEGDDPPPLPAVYSRYSFYVCCHRLWVPLYLNAPAKKRVLRFMCEV